MVWAILPAHGHVGVQVEAVLARVLVALAALAFSSACEAPSIDAELCALVEEESTRHARDEPTPEPWRILSGAVRRWRPESMAAVADASPGACGVHPDRPAVSTCGRCGTFACAECHVDIDEGRAACASCARRPEVDYLGDLDRKLRGKRADLPIHLFCAPTRAD